MKKLLNYFVLLCAAIFMNSCASLTGFEEGRTLGENNSEFGASINYTRTPDIISDDGEGIDAAIGFPNIELNYKYGIQDKFDVGAKLATNLNVTAYGKYQLVGDKISNFALGAGFEVSTFAGLTYTLGVPIYASIYPSDNVAININPRFMYQAATGVVTEGITYLGGNVGLLFGRKHKFGLDVGYYSLGNSDTGRGSMLQFGVGGRFRFGDNLSSDSSSRSERRKRR